MHQKIAAVAGAGDGLSGSGVTGDHDAAVRGIKAVSIRKVPGAVSHGKGSDVDVGVLIDKAGMNLMRVDLVGIAVAVLQTFGPNSYVLYVSCLYVGGHIGDAVRTVEFKRSRPAFDGGSEIEIRQSSRVVRMKVRSESDLQVLWGERGDVLVACGSGGTTHHARAEVNEIGRPIYHYGNRRAGAVRIDDGRARAEDDKLGLGGLGQRMGRAAKDRDRKQNACGESRWQMTLEHFSVF